MPDSQWFDSQKECLWVPWDRQDDSSVPVVVICARDGYPMYIVLGVDMVWVYAGVRTAGWAMDCGICCVQLLGEKGVERLAV